MLPYPSGARILLYFQVLVPHTRLPLVFRYSSLLPLSSVVLFLDHPLLPALEQTPYPGLDDFFIIIVDIKWIATKGVDCTCVIEVAIY